VKNNRRMMNDLKRIISEKVSAHKTPKKSRKSSSISK
jgi:hypothetical protein